MTTSTPPVADQTAVFNYLRDNFGLTDAILSVDTTDPKVGFSLREAFDQIRTSRITDVNRAADIIQKTTWFQNYGANALKNLALRKTNPGIWKRNVQNAADALRQQFNQMGLQVPSSLVRQMAIDSFAYGLSVDNIIDKYQQSLKNVAGSGGEMSLRDYARNMGVKMTDQWFSNAAVAVNSGNQSIDFYKNIVNQQSENTYKYWAKQIKSGQSVADLAGQYLAYAQQWLEDPNIDVMDTTVQRALQGANDGKGPAPLWQFAQTVKSDPRWLRTQNAQQQVTDTAWELLKSWGRG